MIKTDIASMLNNIVENNAVHEVKKLPKAAAEILPETTNSIYKKNGLSLAVAANKGIGSIINAQEIQKFAEIFSSKDFPIEKFLSKIKTIAKTPEYQALSNSDKKVFLATSFIMDYSKKLDTTAENVLDTVHQSVTKYASDSRVKSRIKEQIKGPNLLERLAKRKDPSAALDSQRFEDYSIIKDFCIKYRKPGDIKVANLLMKNGFLGKTDKDINPEALNVIENFVDKIHKNGIWLPTAKIPRASAIKKAPITIGAGDKQTKNVIVDFANDNFEKLGFTKGINKDNFSIIGTAVDEKNFNKELQDYVMKEGTDALLSGTYFQDSKFPTFRQREYGLFLDVDPANIALANKENMASGFGKDFIDFRNNLLTPFKKERAQFADAAKKELAVTEDEYSNLYKKISQSHTIDEIKDENVKTALKNTIQKTIINPNGGINEIVVYCPKAMAVFSKSKNIEDIPYTLRKYAEDKNIPIFDLSGNFQK